MKRFYQRLIYKLWRMIDNAEYAVRRHAQKVGAIRSYQRKNY